MPQRPHFLQPLLTREAGSVEDWSIHVEGRQAPLATRLEGAFDSGSRNRGLLGRNGLAPGTALVIAPSQAVHTFSMRFPIDLVFANREGVVVKTRTAVPKSRIAIALRGFAVIELAAGAIASSGVQVGDRLTIRKNIK
ncbi:MAG TPA: DUF192 domain-containing protein [Vicinamibacterales bacterium]|nr:DUF192 domain-containing protein [Vicinamibacterales bacterium]